MRQAHGAPRTVPNIAMTSVCRPHAVADRIRILLFGDKRRMDIIFNAHEQTAYGAAQAKAEDKARAAEFAALSNPLVLAARAFEKDGKTVLAVLTEPIYLASERVLYFLPFFRILSSVLDLSPMLR